MSSVGLFLLIVFLLVMVGLGAAFRSLKATRDYTYSCPKCGSRMKQIKRTAPKGPFYLDFAHQCVKCSHEIEGGNELETFGASDK